MANQYSIAVRNARLNAIETAIGSGVILKIFTGSKPTDTAAARTGTVLATLTLPGDWMADAVNGQKSKSGTWEDSSADGTGTAGYYTIFSSDGTTAHIQGTVGLSGADMIVDSVQFTAGQRFVITTFTITAGNA